MRAASVSSAGLPGRNSTVHLAMIAGTSTCHMAVSPNPRTIPGVWGPYFGAMLPGLWLNEAGQSATGALLDHILDWHSEGRKLGPDRHAVMAARVEAALPAEGPAFAGNLHVLPDFHGNRSPLADPDSVGVVHGLRLDASPRSLDQLYYATAIGIALGTRHIVDALNQRGYRILHLHLTGGMPPARSWCSYTRTPATSRWCCPNNPTACFSAPHASRHPHPDCKRRSAMRHAAWRATAAPSVQTLHCGDSSTIATAHFCSCTSSALP
jgi:ribulose kinase